MSNNKWSASACTSPPGLGETAGLAETVGLVEGVRDFELVGIGGVGVGGGGLGHFPGLLIPHSFHNESAWMVSFSMKPIASKAILIAQHSPL